MKKSEGVRRDSTGKGEKIVAPSPRHGNYTIIGPRTSQSGQWVTVKPKESGQSSYATQGPQGRSAPPQTPPAQHRIATQAVSHGKTVVQKPSQTKKNDGGMTVKPGLARAIEDWTSFADALAEGVPTSRPPLSDYAVSREGLYEEHL